MPYFPHDPFEMQVLKYSGTVPDLRRVAFGCRKKSTFKSLLMRDIVTVKSIEFTYQWNERNAAFALNQTNITSQ